MHYDLNYVKDNKEAILSSIKRRFLGEKGADRVARLIEINDIIKSLQKEIDALRHERNKISEEFSKSKDKDHKSKEGDRTKVRNLMDEIKSKETQLDKLNEEAKSIFLWLPNVIANDVPDGRDDSSNVEAKRVGDITDRKFKVKNYMEICREKDLVDLENAAKVAGSRFYYLKGKLVQLALAIEAYSIAKIASKGYTPIIPPFMMKKDVYGGIAHMATFEDALYKVSGVEDTGSEDRFLISTTEHPMIAMYSDSVIPEEKLPLKLVGVSPAFRKEAGAHGKDQKGIFRVHQFDQTEQIVFCKPEDSERIHKEMLSNAEEMWKEIRIPYRVVDVCTGDMGIRDVKQYDIEGYLYSQKTYRELGSFDNTTDWISRRLNIKYSNQNGNKFYVNTLGGTGIPVQRALIAILETYQDENGNVTVPEVLRKYTGFDYI